MRVRLRTAVVGLGWVATHRHLPAMQAHGGFELVGLIDRHPDTARRVAQQNGSVRFHCGSTLADVPWLGDVDVVVVATSPFTHHALISEALRLASTCSPRSPSP